MKIVFAASEMVPFAKTGGLADVVGTLTREIRLLGNDVAAFLPCYRSVDIKSLGTEVVVESLEIEIGSEKQTGRVLKSTTQDGVEIYFVENKELFDRDELYGTVIGDYPDNDHRFIFFQRAVLDTLIALKIKPHVIHCHDWQTGLIPVYLKTLYVRDTSLQKAKTVFTIHNLAYQGNFPPDSMSLTGLGWEHFTLQRLEFYGKVSFLKGGVIDADIVTTVSDRYSREIQTKEFGAGLDGVLSQYQDKLRGIVNGIDLNTWDPQNAEDIVQPFSIEHLEEKEKNKAALQRENGLDPNLKTPLLGVVSRLVDQKGIDILIEALDRIMQMGLQVVMLGTGEEKYHRVLREAARKKRGQLGIHILFDIQMAKRIYAGSDMLLMPSYYEPCGLGQMISLRYGTIPIVRSTGGLADTIQDFNSKTGQGNGFVFEDYKSEALLRAVERALKIYEDSPLWAGLVKNAMQCDFSWTASAKKYVQIYKEVERRPIEGLRKG